MGKHSKSPRSFIPRAVGLLAALLVLCLQATVLAEDAPATSRAPKETDDRAMQLDPRAIVKGNVYTDDRRPVPGAVVWLNQVGSQLVWHDEQHDDHYVTTDEAGYFQFDGLETRPCVVNLAPRGLEGVPGDWMKDYQFPETLDVLLTAERPAQQVELVLRKGMTLTGSIVDEKGVPYGGVTVEASAGGKRLKETRSDPGGHFEIPGLSPTTVYTLSCFEQAFDPRSFAKVDMAGGRTLSVTLARMGTVVLKLTDPGGKPVTRSVYTMNRIAEKPSRGFLQPVTAQESVDGRYPVRFLRYARQWLLVREAREGTSGMTGVASLELDLARVADGSEVPIRLQSAGALTGRVLNGADRTPMAGVPIILSPAPVSHMDFPWEESFAPTVETREDGSFTCPVVPPGELYVYAPTEHGFLSEETTVTIPGGIPPPPLEIVLQPAVSVRVRYRGANPERARIEVVIARSECIASHGKGRSFDFRRTPVGGQFWEDGYLKLDGLPPGDWPAKLQTDAGTQNLTLRIPASPTAELTIP